MVKSQVTTDPPTFDPTPDPSPPPTTAFPTALTTTAGPTNAPTDGNCEDQGLIKHINWDKLMDETEGATEIPLHSCVVDFDTSTYQLEVDCDLQYLGYATDDLLYKGNESLGITYSIGLNSFFSSRYTCITLSVCTIMLLLSQECYR